MDFFKQTKVRCPYCGKIHGILVRTYDNICLDGVPQISIQKLMQRFAICTQCGLIYSSQIDNIMPVEKILKAEHYTAAVRVPYKDKTERKLMMLGALCQPGYIPLFLAHHYHETHQAIKYREMLKMAIEYIQSGKDNYVQRVMKCGSIKLKTPLSLYPEYRLIDIYRQLQQWDAAKEQIEKIKTEPHQEFPESLMQYLEFEEKLIQKKDSQIQ